MKSYEQKYKAALEWMQGMYGGLHGKTKEEAEKYFPELAESEDERIRKEIILHLQHEYVVKRYVSDVEYDRWIAWLEKQGKEDSSIQQAYKQGYIEGQRIERKCWLEKQSEKPTLPKWKYKKDNTPLLRDSIILNKYGCVLKSPSGAVVSDAWVLDYDELAKLPKEEIAKQGESKYIPKYRIGDYVKNTNYKGEPIYEIIYMDKECYICEYRGKEKMGDKTVMHFSFDNPYLCLVQKPADKIEPKFHEGEWIVDNNGKAAIIYDLQNAGYVGHYTNGNDFVCKYDNEHLLHLWTIQDAKDGDVLASGHLVFIFKVIHGVLLNCHCSAHNDGSFIADSYDLMTNKYFSEVHPATKEQRDLLFAKMREEGYTFDFDKKELKKIEQNLASSAKISKDDTLLDLLNKMPSYITVDGLDYHFVLKKIGVYIAYYECEGEEGRDKIIFWTAGEPVDILTEMLDKLKKEGLLE